MPFSSDSVCDSSTSSGSFRYLTKQSLELFNSQCPTNSSEDIVQQYLSDSELCSLDNDIDAFESSSFGAQQSSSEDVNLSQFNMKDYEEKPHNHIVKNSINAFFGQQQQQFKDRANSNQQQQQQQQFPANQTTITITTATAEFAAKKYDADDDESNPKREITTPESRISVNEAKEFAGLMFSQKANPIVASAIHVSEDAPCDVSSSPKNSGSSNQKPQEQLPLKHTSSSSNNNINNKNGNNNSMETADFTPEFKTIKTNSLAKTISRDGSHNQTDDFLSKHSCCVS